MEIANESRPCASARPFFGVVYGSCKAVNSFVEVTLIVFEFSWSIQFSHEPFLRLKNKWPAPRTRFFQSIL